MVRIMPHGLAIGNHCGGLLLITQLREFSLKRAIRANMRMRDLAERFVTRVSG